MPTARQAPDRVVCVDPRVHARRRLQFGARRPQLRRDHRRVPSQAVEESRHRRKPSITNAMIGALASLPSVPLAPGATPVEDLSRCAPRLGGGPRLLVKRDDAIAFAFGGNKVRKMRLVAARRARSRSRYADHVRRPAVQPRARHGVDCGEAGTATACWSPTASRPIARPRNALLDRLARRRRALRRRTRGRGRPKWSGLPTDIAIARRQALRDSPRRLDAARCCRVCARRRRAASSRSTPPDVIVAFHLVRRHAGRPPSGLRAGGLSGRESLASAPTSRRPRLAPEFGAIIDGLAELAGIAARTRSRGGRSTVDDRFVGDGYGMPTTASREAIELAARTEALFLDPTYTGKAMAGLIALVRAQASPLTRR